MSLSRDYEIGYLDGCNDTVNKIKEELKKYAILKADDLNYTLLNIDEIIDNMKAKGLLDFTKGISLDNTKVQNNVPLIEQKWLQLQDYFIIIDEDTNKEYLRQSSDSEAVKKYGDKVLHTYFFTTNDPALQTDEDKTYVDWFPLFRKEQAIATSMNVSDYDLMAVDYIEHFFDKNGEFKNPSEADLSDEFVDLITDIYNSDFFKDKKELSDEVNKAIEKWSKEGTESPLIYSGSLYPTKEEIEAFNIKDDKNYNNSEIYDKKQVEYPRIDWWDNTSIVGMILEKLETDLSVLSRFTSGDKDKYDKLREMFDLSKCKIATDFPEEIQNDFLEYLVEQPNFNDANIYNNIQDVHIINAGNNQYNFDLKIDIDLTPIFKEYTKTERFEELYNKVWDEKDPIDYER